MFVEFETSTALAPVVSWLLRLPDMALLQDRGHFPIGVSFRIGGAGAQDHDRASQNREIV